MIDGMASGCRCRAPADSQRQSQAGRRIDTARQGVERRADRIRAPISTRLQRSAPPVGLVAGRALRRSAEQQRDGAARACCWRRQDRADEALALLATIPARRCADRAGPRRAGADPRPNDKRYNEAYAIAATAADSAGRGIERLFAARRRARGDEAHHTEAADAYGRAVALANAQGLKDELWPLLLLQANALEEANRWPEAKAALQQALALAPEQPLLLNFLGYAKLERGEDLDAAEAMIRKASELAPDDASITDSLGWAQFKRGKVDEAIETLQRAAREGSGPGRDPGASRRCAVQVGAALRGALRLARGAGHGRGRGRGAGEGQARGRA